MLQTEQLLQGRYRLDKLLGNNAGRQNLDSSRSGGVSSRIGGCQTVGF